MMRRAVLAAAALTAATFAAALPAQAAGVALAMDEVHTLTFKKPVATVYVGNPTIADITMIDSRHAFVQGKAFGRTNIVALNQDGMQIFNTAVTVTGSNVGTVTLNRGAQRVTYNCGGGRCEAAPMPGDAPDTFQQIVGQASAHENAAKAAAARTAPGQ